MKKIILIFPKIDPLKKNMTTRENINHIEEAAINTLERTIEVVVKGKVKVDIKNLKNNKIGERRTPLLKRKNK